MKTNKFWKYFFNTFKESRWLLLRYLAVGIFLIVVGVVANRMQLNDLTYYNSMMTLCYFAEMLGFGFVEGFGIYINQHFENKEKSKHYAKIGFVFTAIFSLVVAIILCCIPNFIVRNILGLQFKVNYAFYYLMIFSMFISAILHYINNLLKKIGLFKFQMICSIIQCILIISGLLLLVVSSNLVLILISIIYIITYLICTIIGIVLLNKNNTYSVNLLKFEKVKLTKNETFVIFTRAFSELVWEVGYIFLALFILRSNVIAYNQYCYLENALDILNGVFFAFVNVSAIKICRDIGAGKEKEAFECGVNSFKSTFIIWISYLVLTFIFFIPLKYGLNIELRDTALISTIFYVLIYLLRFVDWNVGTYIVGQSEIYAKKGLLVESIAMIYWIVFYIIANYITLNIFMIYLIIAIELLIKISIYVTWFLKKKWTKKLF